MMLILPRVLSLFVVWSHDIRSYYYYYQITLVMILVRMVICSSVNLEFRLYSMSMFVPELVVGY
jgi:hypothetical protein